MVRRIGVVGGGIAGTAAAWALHQGGSEVWLFEQNPALGGNAKTHDWKHGPRSILTGLSVLAWPNQLFHNYAALLSRLGVQSEPVQLRFMIRRGDEEYAQGRESPLGRKYARDIDRFEHLVAIIDAINRRAAGSSEPSLYHAPVANPMNYVSARTLLRLARISEGFYRDLFVGLHASSFLTARLETIPAAILPTLEHMIPLRDGGPMDTWSGSSTEVFARMTEGFRDRVLRGTHVVRVRRGGGGVQVIDDSGAEHELDELILACNARDIGEALDDPSPLERFVFRGYKYACDTDPSFTEGHVHTDESVLPASLRAEILGGYSNYIEVKDDRGGRPRYESHFVISSWVPAARGSDARMLVYYNKPAGRALARVERVITNRRAHPVLSRANLLRVGLIRFLQGKDHLHYCGSYATPGNGHDLSLLSGLAVAERLGAPYPFLDDERARADFGRLKRLMFGGAPGTSPGGR